MNTKIYNKLVRDKIPDIIGAQGKRPIIRTLDSDEFSKRLRIKFFEEIQEFLSNESIEELVDIFEVMLAILDDHKVPFDVFEKMREEKAEKNGQFKKKIFLASVVEK